MEEMPPGGQIAEEGSWNCFSNLLNVPEQITTHSASVSLRYPLNTWSHRSTWCFGGKVHLCGLVSWCQSLRLKETGLPRHRWAAGQGGCRWTQGFSLGWLA